MITNLHLRIRWLWDGQEAQMPVHLWRHLEAGFTQLYWSRAQTMLLKLDSQTQWALVTELLERGVTLRMWGFVWGRADDSLGGHNPPFITLPVPAC